MKNYITICENTIDPDSFETFECKDVREFLAKRYQKFPSNGKLYLNNVATNCDVTPYDEASIERLGKLNGHFFLVTYPKSLLVVLVIVAIALGAVAVIMGYLMRPSLPENQQSGSPNNSLSARENRERINQRIPDIYGELWATPDLIQVPYRIFIGNKEVEYCYMCIGRGYFEIDEDNVRDDVTPINQIAGASCEIYPPFTSPNSGDDPQLRIGSPINVPIKAVKQYSSVNGQILTAPNANRIKGSGNIRFVAGGSIECSDSNIDFTDYFSPSTGANPQYIVISNWSTYAGTYQILDVDTSTIVLSNPGAVNANWNSIGTYTSWGSPILIRSGDNWQGPFYILDNTVTELLCNFVAQQGLYEMDSDGNQHAMNATLQIEVKSLDASGTPQGNAIYYQVVIRGSSELKQQCGATLRATLPYAGACQVRARRISNTDLRDGWQVIDNVQFRDLYATSPITQTDFGNVTTVQTVTWPTPSALAVKSRKLNMLVKRAFNSTTIPSDPLILEEVVVLGPNVYSQPDPDWDINEAGNSAVQSVNAKASALLSNKTLDFNLYHIVNGTFKTDDTDDDYFGFVFGYQDAQHFYVFDWRKVTAGVATLGMHVKKIHASTPLSGSTDLWTCANNTRQTTLYSNTIPYVKGTTYDFTLSTRPNGFTIIVNQGATNIATINVNDTTYPTGRFGMYNYSQGQCTYGGFVATQDETVYYGTKNAADIIYQMAIDPYIGRRLESEIDKANIDAVLGSGGEVETYFGTSLCTEFGFTFDDAKVSFEEMLAQVCQATFCTAFRRGNILDIVFEKATEDSTILFNHRNKIPRSEVRTVNFGVATENDGIDIEYIEPNAPGAPNIDTPWVLHFPQDGTAVAPRKVKAVGIRNQVQAWMLGNRMFNKLQYQTTSVQFEATKEAALCINNERILVADNTKADTQDGEIMAQDGLELTLSQPVTFVEGLNYTMFIQHYDATVEAIAITEGSDERKVVLAEAPASALVLDPEKYARTTYMIVDDSTQPSSAFLLNKKDAKEGAKYEIEAVNYDERYYEHDTDYINDLIDVLTAASVGGSGYSKAAYTTVFVDGKCQPWNPVDNPTYTFGINRAKAPVVVDIQTPEGGTVGISANLPGDIVSTTFVGFTQVNIPSNTVRYDNDDDPAHYDDAEGDPDVITGQTLASGDGWSNKRYPTYYATSPALGRAGLIGAWAKKNSPTAGKYEVIQPFVIGFGGSYTVPAGGVDCLLLGINDAKHSDNDGGFQVSIVQANSTAGDAAGQNPTINDTTTDPNATVWDFTVNGA